MPLHTFAEPNQEPRRQHRWQREACSCRPWRDGNGGQQSRGEGKPDDADAHDQFACMWAEDRHAQQQRVNAALQTGTRLTAQCEGYPAPAISAAAWTATAAESRLHPADVERMVSGH